MINTGIYYILNTVNNKRYVGQAAISFEKRWCTERCHLRANLGFPNRHLQASWNKYGEDVFEFQVLEYIELPKNKREAAQILAKREQYWCDHFEVRNPLKGYNKRRCVESNYGIKFDVLSSKQKAHLKKLHQSRIGSRYTKQSRRKISESIKGTKNPFFGRQHAVETKRKLSVLASKRTGERSSNSKLTRTQVENIKREYQPRVVTYNMLAEKYGVHRNTIRSIFYGRTWK